MSFEPTDKDKLNRLMYRVSSTRSALTSWKIVSRSVYIRIRSVKAGAFSLQGLGVGSHTYLIKDSAGRELVRSSPIDMFDNTVLARFEPGIYIMMLSEPKGRSRMLKFLVI